MESKTGVKSKPAFSFGPTIQKSTNSALSLQSANTYPKGHFTTVQDSDKNLEQSATPTAKFAHFYQFLACRTGRPIITLRHHQEKCVYIHISSNYLTTYISGDITIKLLIDKVILTQNLYAISILCEKRLHQGKA